MRLDQAPHFALQSHEGNHIILHSTGGAVAHVWVLEEDIVRVLVLPQGQLQMPRSWTVAPGLSDLPVEGRDRFDVSGFSLFEEAQYRGVLAAERTLWRLGKQFTTSLG